MSKFIALFLISATAIAVADGPNHNNNNGWRRGPGSHFHRPNQTGVLFQAASNLIDAIQKLDDQAFDQADDFSEKGMNNAVAQLDQVADAASTLERALRRQVIRELQDRDGHDRFGRTLRSLENNEYANLSRAIDNLNRGGFGVQFAIREVEQAWRAFERAIQNDAQNHHGGGAITGQCNGKFGGNFFQKQSHVECSVNGSGVTGYEVHFNNPQTNQSDVVRGTLDPRQRQQNFTSSKSAVGRSAQFAVYVITRNGDRKLLSSGTCQGNPF